MIFLLILPSSEHHSSVTEEGVVHPSAHNVFALRLFTLVSPMQRHVPCTQQSQNPSTYHSCHQSKLSIRGNLTFWWQKKNCVCALPPRPWQWCDRIYSRVERSDPCESLTLPGKATRKAGQCTTSVRLWHWCSLNCRSRETQSPKYLNV